MKKIHKIYPYPMQIISIKFLIYMYIGTIFCIGMYLVPFSIMQFNLDYIPGDLGDARLNNYFLEHGFKWVTGQTKSFWDAPFFYPHSNTMTFSDNHLGTLPIYVFFRLFKIDRETSYQMWFFVIFILNYLSAAFSLKILKIHFIGAHLGAYFFTFSLPVIAHIFHAQLLARFMVPFAFLLAVKYVEQFDSKIFIMLCISIILQFYCSIYLGFLLCLCIFLFFVSFCILKMPKFKINRYLSTSFKKISTIFLILFSSGVALLPLIIPYYHRYLLSPANSWEMILSLLPTIESYLYPPQGTLLWDWLLPNKINYPYPCEHQLFIGIFPWLSFVLVIFLFAFSKKDILLKIGIIVIFTLILSIILTINIDGFTLYQLITLLPGAKAIRGVSRIILIDIFLFCFLFGICFTKIFEILKNKFHLRMLFVTGITFLLIIDISMNLKFDYYPRYAKLASQNRSKEIEKIILMKKADSKLFAYMPKRSIYPPNIIHLDAMLAAQTLNIATINGYSSNSPDGYDFFNYYNLPSSLVKWMHMNGDISGKSKFKNMLIIGQEIDFDKHSFNFSAKPLPEKGYNFEMAFPKYDSIYNINNSYLLQIELKNSSIANWYSLGNGKYQIFMSFRWLTKDRKEISGFNERIPLPYDLSPGESSIMDVIVRTPSEKGEYILEFDLVQEQIFWFYDKGAIRPAINVLVI